MAYTTINGIRINYEIHGNTIPHLHLHVFPRFPGDPFDQSPIDPRRGPIRRSEADLERLRSAIAARAGQQDEPNGSK